LTIYECLSLKRVELGGVTKCGRSGRA